MRHEYLILFLILVALLFISGCVQQDASGEKQAVSDECVKACQDAIALGKNLNVGPCLLNPIPQNSEWVCDVAHSPRQAVDNLPENQCWAYREGTATHFVEVTPECKFIKSV